MHSFPIEHEYGHQKRKQKRKQKIERNWWWNIVDTLTNNLIFENSLDGIKPLGAQFSKPPYFH